MMAHGGSMGICWGSDLRMVQPTVLVQNLIVVSSPGKQKLMWGTLEMGQKHKETQAIGRGLGFIDRIKHRFLDALVTSKIQGGLSQPSSRLCGG